MPSGWATSDAYQRCVSSLMLPFLHAGCADGKTQCGTSCTGGDTCCKTDNTPGKVCGEACIGDDQCCTTDSKPGKLCGDVCINTENQVRPVALANERMQSSGNGWPGAAPDPFPAPADRWCCAMLVPWLQCCATNTELGKKCEGDLVCLSDGGDCGE